jgi:hypothetical protein
MYPKVYPVLNYQEILDGADRRVSLLVLIELIELIYFVTLIFLVAGVYYFVSDDDSAQIESRS